MTKQKGAKQLWELPWKYKESFLIVAALLLASILIEIATASAAPVIMWPANIVILLLLANISILLHILARKQNLFKWFSSIPASIAAIVFFVVPSLVMALVPQSQTESFYFLYAVTSSWTYFIAVGFFLIILGTVTAKRLFPLTKKNIGFAVNHTGLWICIACANFGSGDMEKYSMVLEEGKTIWYAYNTDKETVELDFAIKLRDFSIDQYPAKLAFVNNNTSDIVDNNGKRFLVDTEPGKTFTYKEVTYTIQKYLPSSAPVQNRFEPVVDMGAAQSALIQIISGTDTTSQWLSSHSTLYPQQMHKVDSTTTLLMLRPETKLYSSAITIYEKQGGTQDTVIEVNRPIEVGQWKVYQTGYDEKKGKWSTISILEIVKDPWLQYVYIGIYLMIAGALYLIWIGKKKEVQDVE